MKLEDKVVSLELAMELKENGYPQEGEFWWVYNLLPNQVNECSFQLFRSGELMCIRDNKNKYYFEPKNDLRKDKIFSAPLASELMERLPTEFFPLQHNEQGGWAIMKCCEPQFKETSLIYKDCCIRADTLCNALAKMWLYLKKQGLLK